MPDLTVHATYVCRSNVDWSTTVGTHEVRFGRLFGRDRMREGCDYGYTCDCKGFHFRGSCSHVTAAKSSRCGWNWEMEPFVDASENAAGEPCCPDCGGPIEAIQVAV